MEMAQKLNENISSTAIYCKTTNLSLVLRHSPNNIGMNLKT